MLGLGFCIISGILLAEKAPAQNIKLNTKSAEHHCLLSAESGLGLDGVEGENHVGFISGNKTKIGVIIALAVPVEHTLI